MFEALQRGLDGWMDVVLQQISANTCWAAIRVNVKAVVWP